MDVLKYADINPDGAKNLAQRLHRKKDELNLVRKFIAVDKVESDDEERTITARVSTNDRDRDGEIVEPKGIDLSNYQKNPCLLWAHKYDVPAIGKALWSKTDEKGMICKFEFAKTQFADEIYQLYRDGYQRAFSIGFIPIDFDSKEKVFNKVQILEVSAVPVPANQDALVMEAYAKGIVKSEALMQDLNIVMTPDKLADALADGYQANADLDAKMADVAEPVAEAEKSEPEVPFDAAALMVQLDALHAEIAQLTLLLLEGKETPAPAPAPEVIVAPPAPAPVPEPPAPEDVLDGIEDDLPPVDEVDLDELLKSGAFKNMVNEAVEVGLAKLRGRVI